MHTSAKFKGRAKKTYFTDQVRHKCKTDGGLASMGVKGSEKLSLQAWLVGLEPEIIKNSDVITGGKSWHQVEPLTASVQSYPNQMEILVHTSWQRMNVY